MRMSISIMGHPSRQQFFGYLRDTIGDCTIPISVDNGWGIWENCKRAWQMHDPKAEFHLVLQDDAIVCKNFKEKAEKILTDKSMAYNFYFGNRKSMIEVAKKGEKIGGVMTGWMHWGVAICLPVRVIDDMIIFCDKIKGLQKHDDTRIANFVRSIKMKVWYPIPSLIDHRWEEKSLIENSEGVKKRIAYKFIGE